MSFNNLPNREKGIFLPDFDLGIPMALRFFFQNKNRQEDPHHGIGLSLKKQILP